MKNKTLLALVLPLIMIGCKQKTGNPDALVKQHTDTIPQGIVFKCNQVTPSAFFLSKIPVSTAMKQKAGKEILYAPDAPVDSLIHSKGNGFIDAIYESYDKHFPLILSPQSIWLTICQGISVHINYHFSELRPILFKSEEKETLLVRNDSLPAAPRHWAQLISDFATQTRNFTQHEYYDFFVPSFSTITPIEQTVFQVTLMESFNQAYEYTAETGCGIPRITLTGTRADWQQILTNLIYLDRLGLQDWHEVLQPVISEFIAVYDGNINHPFWENLFKTASDYNAEYISGWILKFYPYIKIKENTNTGITVDEEYRIRYSFAYKKNPFLKDEDYRMSDLQADNFPSGMACVPIKWINHFTGDEQKLEIYAGFVGTRQYPDYSLEPFISWFTANEPAPAVLPLCDNNQVYPELSHTNQHDWYPYVLKTNLSKPALYDSAAFASGQESLEFVRSEILKKLKKEVATGDSISFVIMDNGKPTTFRFYKASLHADPSVFLPSESPEEIRIAEEIATVVRNLPGRWSPARDQNERITKIEIPDRNIREIPLNSLITFQLEGDFFNKDFTGSWDAVNYDGTFTLFLTQHGDTLTGSHICIVNDGKNIDGSMNRKRQSIRGSLPDRYEAYAILRCGSTDSITDNIRLKLIAPDTLQFEMQGNDPGNHQLPKSARMSRRNGGMVF